MAIEMTDKEPWSCPVRRARYRAAERRNCETLTRRTGANFCARCLRAAALNRSGCAAKSTDKLPLRSRGVAVCTFVRPPGIFAHLFLAAPTLTINASRIPNLNRNLRPVRSRRMSHRNYGKNITYLNHIISYSLLQVLHICYCYATLLNIAYIVFVFVLFHFCTIIIDLVN